MHVKSRDRGARIMAEWLPQYVFRVTCRWILECNRYASRATSKELSNVGELRASSWKVPSGVVLRHRHHESGRARGVYLVYVHGRVKYLAERGD